MTSRRLVLLTALFAACGDSPTDSASAGDTTSAPTVPTSPTDTTLVDPTTGPGGTSSTGPGGTGTATDSGTTEATTATTTATSPSTSTTSDVTTVADTGTSEPVDTTTEADTTTDAPGTSTGPDATGTSEAGETTEGATVCECPDIEVPLDDGIFLFSTAAELWKFKPEFNSFTKIGDVACPGLFSTFSLAVDRQGFAWVQYFGGELRKIPVSNPAACENPGFVANQAGVGNFGMAFVSNSAGDPCDRIYGNTYSGLGGYTEGPDVGDVVKIDPDTLQLTKFGKSNFDGAEVTGTGDGRMFVFGGANPSKLVQFDKATGAKLLTFPLNGLEINNGAFAFAFFAGDFYFFTSADFDGLTEVTHLDFDDSDGDGMKQLTKVVDAAPITVVGAGVSTCAPFLPQ
jgi:hypothetical protein